MARRIVDIAGKRVIENEVFKKWAGKVGLKKRFLVRIEKDTRKRRKRNLV